MRKFSRKTTMFSALFFATLPLVYSQGVIPPGMQTLADNILDIFTSGFVRVILAIFLCGSALAYGFNKDNDKVKRNAIAIGIASAILVVATTLIDLIWGAAGG